MPSSDIIDSCDKVDKDLGFLVQVAPVGPSSNSMDCLQGLSSKSMKIRYSRSCFQEVLK